MIECFFLGDKFIVDFPRMFFTYFLVFLIVLLLKIAKSDILFPFTEPLRTDDVTVV